VATEVGEKLKEIMARDLGSFRATQIALIATCLFLSLCVGTAFLRYERRREEDFLALEEVKESLEEQVAERKSAQDALQKAQDQLERRVEERTAELSESNALLSREIAERKVAEEALRQSEKQLRLLPSHLLSTQERERRRISMELHDDLGQSLTVLKLRLRSAEKQLAKDKELSAPGGGRAEEPRTGASGSKQDFAELSKCVDQIIDSVHRLSRDLSPSIIEDLGLTAAIRYRTEDFAKHAGVKFSLDLADVDELFPVEAKTTIYRIFQEAFTNIGKHAGASNVSVVVKKEEGCVCFCIRDDGKGLDPKRMKAKSSAERSLGLATMNERVRMLGGELEIEGQERKGTEIRFRVPVGMDGP
jgi:signal transduction histidine kinase